MLALEIATSKTGCLWATEYWKTLIDAVSRGSAKHDPRLKYPDLRAAISHMVAECGQRYGPTPGSPLEEHDDVSLKMIIVRHAAPGTEFVRFLERDVPDTSSWKSISFPYFGTIGDSKYEKQTKCNREQLADVFVPAPSPAWLGLAFQLSQILLSLRGRDRDLDNLTDALMPFFNRHVSQLEAVILIKLQPVDIDAEMLRYRCETVGDGGVDFT